MSTYIKLYRKSLDSAVFASEPLWRLWSYLLLSANWQERQLADGTVLKPGQMVRGYRRIADDLHWPVSKASRWAKRLELLGNITICQRNGTLAQVISICNWGTYQAADGTNGTLAERKENASGTLAERKEERKKGRKKETPLPVFPEALNSNGFRDVWIQWAKHRVEIKHPLTPTQIAAQLKKFAKWGETRAIAAIEHTIEKGWQGIREPDENETGTEPKQKVFVCPPRR